MLILVSANNYLMTFVGWEGVGLCSYLLISFWWDRVDEDGKPMNANAGRKAFIVNRIGDFAVIIAMTMLFWTFGTLNYEPIFEQAVEFFAEGRVITIGSATFSIDAVITIVTALLLLGVAGKSAQIPLYIWLPDAMAGPTPVSALIHAATMVTAGVFLIVRSNVLYELARISDVPVLRLNQFAGTCRLYRRIYGPGGRADRFHPMGYQEGPRLFHRQPVRLHGGGGRHGRLCCGDVPPGRTRLLQSIALPWFRLSHTWHGTWTP